MANILIADDEKDIIRLLRMYLEKDGHVIYEAYDGEMAYMIMKNYEIDVALLDIMMPRLNGFDLIKKIRKEKKFPVMFISAKTDVNDRVLGIDLGAEDYITKPFEPLEVVAKVNARLRTSENYIKSEEKNETNSITVHNLNLNMDECVIYKDGQRIDLTKAEFLIMELFMSYPGKVFTKDQIYSYAWKEDYIADDNTIRVIISKLRDKIGPNSIKTIRGLGYRLEKTWTD